MVDGNEYGSIIHCIPESQETVVSDIRRALSEVEKIRGRRAICYFSNVVRNLPGPTQIESSDDLPFNEMLAKIPDGNKDIDVLVVTPGGMGQQVYQFVNSLRNRFETVEFLLPYMCMSAGTLWVLSGDQIWMDKRAFIGPIDPQVLTQEGRFVPAQSIMVLLRKIQEDGERRIKEGKTPDWSLIRLLDKMDHRNIGEAISSSKYSIKLASEFLNKYKFKHWLTHSSTGTDVTPSEREARANWVAEKLCSHEYWLSHGQGITREMAESGELRLKIRKFEEVAGLEKAVRRLWAIMYWLFDKGPTLKTMFSQEYILVRHVAIVGGTKA